MEIFGVDLAAIPAIKLIFGAAILILGCCAAILPLVSRKPEIRFIKRTLLLVLLVAIIYLNIHGYSTNPYVFLAGEIAVLIVCYKLFLNILKRLGTTQGEVDSVSRYINEIKRKSSGS